MDYSENVRLNLNIGSQRIPLTVPFSRQDFVRDVEKEINSLYWQWRKEFPTTTERELLAMVAYRFASFYCELREENEKAALLARECISLADKPADKPADKADDEL